MKMNMINVVPVLRGNVAFAISEIRRQRRDVGLRRFAVSLSFHPEGTPARVRAEALCDSFRRIREELRDDDVEIGALIQSTQGHGWNGKVPLTDEKWQYSVEIDGSPSPRLCQLDPDFGDYVMACIKGTVEAGAAFLLVDDDFGPRRNECFCPLHLAEYAKALGRPCTREECREIAARDYGDPEANAIAETRRRVAVDFARRIRETIDAVDPTIRCGMCAPSSGYGFVGEVAMALAGGTEPFVRVNNAIYGLSNPTTAFYWKVQQTNRVRNRVELAGVRETIDESDTFPQTYWSESALAFRAHIAEAVLNGLHGCKLWTSEFSLPVDTGSQARYEAVLRDNAAFYDALLETCGRVKWVGCAGPLLTVPYENYPVKCCRALNYLDWNIFVCGPFAQPVCYARPDDWTEGRVFNLCGQDIPLLSDAGIEAMLARPVLVDGEAAKALTQRGFAPLLGVEADDGDVAFSFSSEHVKSSGRQVGFMWEATCARLKPLSEGVHVAAEFCRNLSFSPDQTAVAPSMTLFTNRLGGRVATVGWSVPEPYHKMYRNPRRAIVVEALDILAGGFFEMGVEILSHVLVRHGLLDDGRELLTAMNCCPDDVNAIPLRLRRTPKAIAKLRADGTWSPIEFSRRDPDTLVLATPLRYLDPCVFALTFK